MRLHNERRVLEAQRSLCRRGFDRLETQRLNRTSDDPTERHYKSAAAVGDVCLPSSKTRPPRALASALTRPATAEFLQRSGRSATSSQRNAAASGDAQRPWTSLPAESVNQLTLSSGRP